MSKTQPKLFSSQGRLVIIVLILFLIIASLAAYFLFFQISGADVRGQTDTLAPLISDLKIEQTTETSTQVFWKTDEPADATVLYSLDSSFNLNKNDSSFSLNHSILLSGLTEGTRYYYKVVSKDAVGNQATSGEFATLSNSPIIIDNTSRTQTYGSGHFLTFETIISDASPIIEAKVHFGQGGKTNINRWNHDLSRVGATNNFKVSLGGLFSENNLTPDRPVDYWIEVKDSADKIGQSPIDYPNSFSSITLTQPDTTAPTITYSPNPAPSQPSDQDLQLIAAIEDTAPGTIAEAKLHFKNSGDNNWQQEAVMTAVNPGTTNSYKGIITKDKFIAGQNINFYFEAKDNSGNSAVYPTGGQSAALTINLDWPADTPTITHAPVTSAPSDQMIVIRAQATDSSGLREVKLWTKNQLNTNFADTDMVLSSPNTYTASIPSSAYLPGQDFYYYLEAINNRNIKATSPNQAPANFYTIDLSWDSGNTVIDLPATVQAVNYTAKGSLFNQTNHFLDNSPVMRTFTSGSESYLTYRMDFGTDQTKTWTLKVRGANGTNSLPPKPLSTMDFDVYLDQTKVQPLVFKATNDRFTEGLLDLGPQTGVKQLKLQLINDFYSPGNFDNNPTIKEISLEQRNISTYSLPTNPIMAIDYHKKGSYIRSYFHHRLSPLENLDAPVMVAFSNDPKASLQYKVDFGRDPRKNWVLKVIGANFGPKPKPNTVINLDVYIDRDGSEAEFIKIGNLSFPANGAEYQGASLNLPTSSTGIKNIKLVYTNDYYHYDPNNPDNSYDNNALIRSLKIEQR